VKRKKSYKTGVLKLLPIFLLAAVITLTAASCGSSTSSSSSAQTSTKLPPGVTADSSSSSETLTAQQTDQSQGTTNGTNSGTTSQSTTSSTTTTTQTTPQSSANLAGANFTVVAATRPSNNKAVITSSQRQIDGDYLEIELSVQNVGSALVDLSTFSFRLYSPAITASQYEDYYGTTVTYGAYVSKHVISATLLDFSNLQAVTYKVKEGETVSKVFLFFDLNPQSTAKNTGVTKDGTNLIIYDTNSGDSVEINLAGYPD
jgi:hypothetical protein